jgi:glycerol-3-phosphate dehydrogenase subunit B
MKAANPIRCDVCVIGTGIAGNAAALFAANRGLATVQIGRSGEILFATGLLDLMGVHPLAERRSWRDPWAAIEAVRLDLPSHPYARLAPAVIRSALDEFLGFLSDNGLPYRCHDRQNVEIPTALGTLKPTFAAPVTMWKAMAAMASNRPGLLFDIAGLKGYSARLIAQNLRARWPNLRTARIRFPGSGTEVFSERMARALETAEHREALARRVRQEVRREQIVGFPAMLGVSRSAEVAADLEKRLGLAVFEIATMPPSVPGLRLRETFEQGLRTRGVRLLAEQRVFRARPAGQAFELEAGGEGVEAHIQARGVVLATGRFLGGGLAGDRRRVRETLFGLPVTQPEERTHWHRRDFFAPAGHPINRCGVEIDARFRPLAKSGRAGHPALVAAGSLLAHQDWMRMKCGSGLAIATALGAVGSLAQTLGGPSI